MTFDAKEIAKKSEQVREKQRRKEEEERKQEHQKQMEEALERLPEVASYHEKRIEEAASRGESHISFNADPYMISLLEDHFRNLGFRITHSEIRYDDDGPLEDIHYIEWGEEEKLSTAQWNYRNRY